MEDMVDYQQLVNTYRGKRVFVTGHTGFKGAWMLKTLALLGAEIKGFALDPQTKNDLFYLIEGDKLCESVIADLRDRKKLESEIVSFQPDFIFHLAAQPLVRLSYEMPVETFEVNVIGTAYLLDAVKLLKKKCSVVLITTDKVYHNNEWIYPYRECDRLGGYDPYSASKACSELLIDSYRNSFFNSKEYKCHLKGIAVARAGNVIGGGDWSKDRLMPDIVRSLMANKPVVIRNPYAVRPWQHVLEPIFGYLILGMQLDKEPENFSQAYNFGPHVEDALSVVEISQLAIAAWGSGECQIRQEENQPHEAGLLKLDISKVKFELNWSPLINSVKSVKMTIEWYLKFELDKEQSNLFTTQQISDFIANSNLNETKL
ncbi:MAG: CDP-glucose 4,6-dehydratase [Bacteroidetes bacterium]|nr:CDP-glucose 4,6-dehydratase [Bacteroidota bacterium]